MLLENPKTGTVVGISCEDGTYFLFLQRKNGPARNCSNYTMDRRNVTVLLDMCQKMGESRIFCKNAISYHLRPMFRRLDRPS